MHENFKEPIKLNYSKCFRFVGDCQIALACELFLKERGLELLERNLYRNYIVHLDSMFNYGLISPQVICSNIRKLNVSFYLFLFIFQKEKDIKIF